MPAPQTVWINARPKGAYQRRYPLHAPTTGRLRGRDGLVRVLQILRHDSQRPAQDLLLAPESFDLRAQPLVFGSEVVQIIPRSSRLIRNNPPVLRPIIESGHANFQFLGHGLGRAPARSPNAECLAPKGLAIPAALGFLGYGCGSGSYKAGVVKSGRIQGFLINSKSRAIG